MSLLQKILIAPAVSLLLMIILAATGYWAANVQHLALKELFDVRFSNTADVENLRSGVLDAHARTYRTLTWSASLGDAYVEKETKALIADLEKLVTTFTAWTEQSNLNTEERELGKQVLADLIKYKKSVTQSLDMAGSDINSGIMMMQSADANFKKLSEHDDQLVALERKLAQVDVTRAATVFQRGGMISVVLLLAAISIASTLSYLVLRSIMGQLGGEPSHAAEVTRKIADGDLTAKINLRAGDYTSLLASMKHMQDALHKVVSQVRDSADRLAADAANMSVAANKVSSGSNQQGEATGSMAAAMEQMTVSIQHVAASASEASTMTVEAGNLSREGEAMTKSAVSEINKIAESFHQSSELISSLSVQSDKISVIVNVIKEIADQTNLLALNAAIEAARAGEQGRGFAVVADEVRKLAERTTVSTQEIATMIQAIQSGARNAMQGMNDGDSQVGEGVRMAATAGDAMTIIGAKNRDVMSAVADISAALNEQSSTSTLISQNVEKIAQMSEENSAAVEEVNVAAEHLQSLSGSLKALVTRFKL